MARRNDKRIRLVEAADALFHQQGVSNTTLANIAQLANVPLGNVYYYFKSKDSIILAVLELRKRQFRDLSEQWEQNSDPKSRLLAFVKHTESTVEVATQYGDSLGSLCQELGKQGGEISVAAADLMSVVLDWCENQFKSIHESASMARRSAVNLLAAIQGINLLTLTFKNEDYLKQESDYLAELIQNS